MKRRTFLKTGSLLASSLFLPSLSWARELDLSGVQFDASIYEANGAQTIIFFLYGGPSELGANLNNIAEINSKSENDYYDYFGTITPTTNHFWAEAGGEALERMLANGDLNLFRTCYSQLREDVDNRSHGACVEGNQIGYNGVDRAGVFSILAKVLYDNGKLDSSSYLPFITLDSEPSFFSTIDVTVPNFLRPLSISGGLANPYADYGGQWYYRTHAEHQTSSYPSIIGDMNELSLLSNPEGVLKENFKQRETLKTFIQELEEEVLPEGVEYPDNGTATTLKNAVKIMIKNPETKVITSGSNAFGTWDEHSDAIGYIDRMKELMEAIEAAMSHIKAAGKEDKINIIVFGDFGRGVNLNASNGWDHGNNQNLFLFGGKEYYNPLGIVGETYVHDYGQVNRQYTRPQEGSYWFEPFSIAATLYRLYGITNPEMLTGGHPAIEAGLLRR